MKLCRYGPKGQEKPGIVDADGRIRDSPAMSPTSLPTTIAPGATGQLTRSMPERLPLVEGEPRYGVPVAGIGKIIAIGLNYRRPCRRIEPADPARADDVHQGDHLPAAARTTTSCMPARCHKTDWEVELGVVIGKTCRYVERSRRARSCRRLCAGQRRVRARLPEGARHAMGQGQGLRHLRPGRPLAGHGRRGGRSAGPRHVARCQRQARCRPATPRP